MPSLQEYLSPAVPQPMQIQVFNDGLSHVPGHVESILHREPLANETDQVETDHETAVADEHVTFLTIEGRRFAMQEKVLQLVRHENL